MTLDSFITKLNQNLEEAKVNLRIQLSEKVEQLAESFKDQDFSSVEMRNQLENLVEDFMIQFTAVYEEFISYVEVQIPVTPPKTKPKKPKEPREINKNEFVRPTYVKRAFNDEGLRVAKDAKPLLMDLLNKRIEEDIEKIKLQLPTFQKGEKEGEKKRITITPEDLKVEDLLKQGNGSFEKEIDSIPIQFNGDSFKLLLVLKPFD